MQYSQYTVSVTKGSATVIGQPGCKFLANVAPGNAFKVKGSPVVYTVSEVTDDTTFILSVPFTEASTSSIQYQVTRDYTPNFGLAEINVGDQDWPTHLTQQTIRKIDAALGAIFIGAGGGNVVTNGSSTTVTATVTGDFWEIKVGSYVTANGVSRTVVDKDFETNSTITVNAPVDWSNNGNGYSWTYSLGNAFRDAEINVGLAKTSAETAVVAAAGATDAADTATTKADIATDKATEASDSASSAAVSAVDAAASEQAAKASETNAAASAHDADESAVAAAVSEQVAKESKDAAKYSEDNAAASARAAEEGKDAAHLSELAAAASAGAAEESKDAAHLSELAAASSAQAADSSASDAASSAHDAASSALSLASALYSFRETFLGELAEDPAVDGNGHPIKDGATYSNTTTGKIRVYSIETGIWRNYDEDAQAATTSANLSALSAAGSAGEALNSKEDAEAAAAVASQKAQAADASAQAAAGSAVSANDAATEASQKAQAANTSAQSASESANAADLSAQAAAQSAVEATNVVAAGTPVASQTVRGGVKVDGSTITITNEIISASVPTVTSLVQDSNHRFVTDAEKTIWNGKQNALTAGVDYLTPAGQVQPDWNASTGKGTILNKPSFAVVATSGSYTDLSNKPSFAAPNQTMYIGTTAVAINRSSGALNLTGVNIDGSAGSVAAGSITQQVGMWTSGTRPGPYRLYRRDVDSNYSVQTYWDASRSYWILGGYNSDDSFHAGCSVTHADNADVTKVISQSSDSSIYNNQLNQLFSDTTPGVTTNVELNQGGPTSGWHFIETMRHTNAANLWGKQYAHGWEQNADRMWSRNCSSGTWGNWVEFITSANIGNQSVAYAALANRVTYSPSRNDSSLYPVLWGADEGGKTIAYSCDAVRIQSSTGLLSANGFLAYTDFGVMNAQTGSGTQWVGRVGSKNTTTDIAVFMGNYNGLSVLASHNSALSAWKDLYINSVDGLSGGNVRLPSGTYINGQAALHMGNFTSQIGFNLPSTSTVGGSVWPALVATKADGVTELGHYIDLHLTSGESADSTVRLEAINSSTITLAGNSLLHASNFTTVTGIAHQERSGGDVNTWITPGFYGLGNTETNRPSSWGAGFVSRSADCVLQLFHDWEYGNGLIYRTGNPPVSGGVGSWGSWKQIFDTTNLTNLNQLTNGPGYITSSGSCAAAAKLTGPAATNGNDGWFRSTGSCGWYNSDYATGIWSQGAGLVETYNNSSFKVNGTLYATGNVVAYYSDERLKERIGSIENALDKVCSLDGFYYRNNALARELGYSSDELQVGLSAQSTEKVLPEIVHPAPFDMAGEITNPVSKSGKDFKTVDYARMAPLFVEAFKEQRNEVDSLRAEVASLRSQIQELTSALYK